MTTQRAFASFVRQHDLGRYGLAQGPVDLLVPLAAKRSKGRHAAFHVWKNDVPAYAFLQLEKGLLVSSPEFVLLQMASYHPRMQPVIDGFVRELRVAQDVQGMIDPSAPAPYDNPFEWNLKVHILRMVLLIMEFSGTYRLLTLAGDAAYRMEPLMTKESAARMASEVPHLYGASRVREALSLALENSASPMEAALALMLALPVAYGGYGLPRPLLNEGLPTGEHGCLWDGGAVIHPDLVWKDKKLAIEYDSDEFHGERGPFKIGSDAERMNVLTGMGYTVLRATAMTMRTPRGVARLAQQVAERLGCELDDPDQVTAIRRNKLFALLMGW